MTTQPLPSEARLMRQLHLVVKNGLMARDILVMYALKMKPGMNGQTVAHTVGSVDRSAVHSAFQRLERYGWLEDRREARGRAHTSAFFLTEAGEAKLKEILEA